MRRAICYHGRVQGVGFRATTRSLARDLPVTGFVRNEPDGSVRLEVQGDPAPIDTLLARIRERLGPFITSEQATTIPDARGEKGLVIAL